MNKKRTLWAVRIILIALIVCWMMTIFDFSAANGQQSQSYSDGITIKIIRLIKKDCNLLSKDRQQEYFNQVSFFVRKTGHFGEYGILSLLWSSFLLTFESIRKIKKKIRIGKVCMIQQKQGRFPCAQKTGHRNPDKVHRFRTYGGYRR